MRRTMASDTRPGPRAFANMVRILLRLFRIVVELEIEVVLRLLFLEACLDRDRRRQRGLRKAGFEERSATASSERNGLVAVDDAAREPLRNEGAGVLVVHIQAEARRRRMCRL